MTGLLLPGCLVSFGRAQLILVLSAVRAAEDVVIFYRLRSELILLERMVWAAKHVVIFYRLRSELILVL